MILKTKVLTGITSIFLPIGIAVFAGGSSASVLISALLLSALIAVGIIFWLIHATKPSANLLAVVKEISNGALHRRLPLNENAEWCGFISSINHVLDAMQQQTSALQSYVGEINQNAKLIQARLQDFSANPTRQVQLAAEAKPSGPLGVTAQPIIVRKIGCHTIYRRRQPRQPRLPH